ncbi:unnamed protein product [Menidia menidia]|uniref:protein-tyrosine-phosphatase n=1 Tax=Menidia menidia TaxID=238744 RepID=A0A8S4B4X4_9TELE|nr:unnamed protein product [Menidia menidia]
MAFSLFTSTASPVPAASRNSHAPPTTVAPVTTSNELKPCPSPFKMKAAAGLQERRGSNVSLVLDMSALGSVEPLNVAVVTPRETAAREYLLSAGRPLTRQQLLSKANNPKDSEYRTSLFPSSTLEQCSFLRAHRVRTLSQYPHSRVILKSKSSNDPLGSYINANYIRAFLCSSGFLTDSQ